jgi:PBP1b-binding outer membrane lipoprotein LpoB
MKRLLITTALVLSGCATDATKTETVEVKVPVAVQPITPPRCRRFQRPLGPRPSKPIRCG